MSTPSWGTVRPGTIRGCVRDTGGKPVSYANVVVLGTAWGAMSNDSGCFMIRNVPKGTFALKTMCIGYEDRLVDSVEVLPDLATNQDFELKQKVVGIVDMVEITAARQLIKLKSTETGHSIHSSSLENLPVDEVSEAHRPESRGRRPGGRAAFPRRSRRRSDDHRGTPRRSDHGRVDPPE